MKEVRTKDDVCIAAKFMARTLRVNNRMLCSSPVAASINHMSISFYDRSTPSRREDRMTIKTTYRLVMPIVTQLRHLPSTLIDDWFEVFHGTVDGRRYIREKAASNTVQQFEPVQHSTHHRTKYHSRFQKVGKVVDCVRSFDYVDSKPSC